MLSRRLAPTLLLLTFLSSVLALAAQPIPNWAAPPTWTPPRASSGARTIQSDVTGPIPFIGVNPCRVVDTRNANGPFGGPIFSVAEARTYALATNPACPGFPVALFIGAYSVNVTVTQTAGTGFVSAYPTGSTRPLVSTVNWVGAGQSVSNAAIVPTGALFAAGKIDVYASQQTHVVIDVNGYYATTPANTASRFYVFNSGHNAIVGEATGSGVNDSGVFGHASATSGVTDGVWGQSDSSSDFSAGVLAINTATSGMTFGLFGRTSSNNNSTAGLAKGVYGEAVGQNGIGVMGISPGTTVNASSFNQESIGVFGAGLLGVQGFSSNINGSAVVGILRTPGTPASSGFLGIPFYGVYAFEGDIGCHGCTKQFVEPHPTDASKTIHYVSLEGPEAGTYFRGTGRTIRGYATIDVPDHFRWVTQEEGMTVQLTPIGDLAIMAVVSQNLSRIVVRSSKDVSFHYLVQGIRPSHSDFQPVVAGTEYAPRNATDRMSDSWPALIRHRLVENGTYNADGTVNMETAERLGWTRRWAEREASAKTAKSAE